MTASHPVRPDASPLLRKERFLLPDGILYLDGNSLGPLPRHVPERLDGTVREEWGQSLIRGWNEHGWMDMPRRIGDRIARLIGADPGTVVLGDTLSIKVHQALSAALEMRPERRLILSDSGNFPTDLYMAEGLIAELDRGHALRLGAPEDVIDRIDDSVAAVMLTHVDYRTGRLHDMEAITRAAHAAGAVMIWDLAHSAGALPLDLAGLGAEFAVGCTYKYLNGGPGAPAFIQVRPDLIDAIRPALSGWLGHAAPFAFEPSYRPGEGIERMRVGTPPVLQMAALDAALDLWDDVDMDRLRAASIRLSERFISEVEARCPELDLASPRDPEARGSQVSFRHPEGYAMMQALIADGVIGDFRAPDLMRFGFTPLYLSEADVVAAVDVLERITRTRSWDRSEFRARARVT
ncbi:kynureninase [Litorisediminicola beolgyonensis]|uniref:Kynureninase n=1 Tax=Litorisediminicola beolgyonensis TaxID=1173614 RepID=A0ABW3ZLX3_9RHOB